MYGSNGYVGKSIIENGVKNLSGEEKVGNLYCLNDYAEVFTRESEDKHFELAENISRLNVYIEMFVGQDEDKQFELMKQLVDKDGFTHMSCTGRGCAKTDYFTKAGLDYIFAFTYAIREGREYCLPIIMDVEFAKRHYMKDGKFDKIIRLNGHSNKNSELTPVMDYNGKKNVKVHRVYMKELGYNIEGLQIDHLSHCQGAITELMLRPCTNDENQLNKVGVEIEGKSDYEYNALQDFRFSFWIPFLCFILGVVSFDDMTKLKEMEIAIKKKKFAMNCLSY